MKTKERNLPRVSFHCTKCKQSRDGLLYSSNPTFAGTIIRVIKCLACRKWEVEEMPKPENAKKQEYDLDNDMS